MNSWKRRIEGGNSFLREEAAARSLPRHAVKSLPKPVTLTDVKANPELANMSLVTSMRLSVQPVKPEEWAEVCRMGGLDA